MASNDYDDLLESFMSNSTKAYNEDKTNRENADTVPASYSVSSNSDKKAKKIQRGRDIEKELVQKQEKKLKKNSRSESAFKYRSCRFGRTYGYRRCRISLLFCHGYLRIQCCLR